MASSVASMADDPDPRGGRNKAGTQSYCTDTKASAPDYHRPAIKCGASWRSDFSAGSAAGSRRRRSGWGTRRPGAERFCRRDPGNRRTPAHPRPRTELARRGPRGRSWISPTAASEFWVGGWSSATADGGAELTLESAPAQRPSRSTRLAPGRRRRLRGLRGGGRRGRAPVLPDPRHRCARSPRRDQHAARPSVRCSAISSSFPPRSAAQRRGGGHQLLARALPRWTAGLRVRRPPPQRRPEAGIERPGRASAPRSTTWPACAPSSGRSAISSTRSPSRDRPASSKGGCCRRRPSTGRGCPSCAAGSRTPIASRSASGAVTVECSLVRQRLSFLRPHHRSAR